jgi:Transposase zinc-binding domain/Putative transposase
VARPALEVADIFRDHGAAWRSTNAGHVSLGQLKVMSAIERCRTAALGGHVAACERCDHTHVAYNSCRNRHCPKCQGAAAKAWLAEREAELLPVQYYHVVFTLPAAIADIAYQNKAVIYDLLFRAASETLLTIAADPRHLGARIGITAVLHTWGSALTHHPHVHIIVPGGGLSPDGSRWIAGWLQLDPLAPILRHDHRPYSAVRPTGFRSVRRAGPAAWGFSSIRAAWILHLRLSIRHLRLCNRETECNH